jgi:CRP/FNR family transcriptional regulator
MFAPLISHIRRFISLSEPEAEILISYLKHSKIKKKEHLLSEGEICTANYFVLKGCIRSYFFNDKEIEQTLLFAIENWWITDYMSLESGKPSHFNIQAIENSEVAILDKKIQEELFAAIPQLERYFRMILQRSYAASQIRIKFIYSLSGEERYRQFNASFPEFVQRVPQYMLASYLGFTPEFLSKIRAKHS